MIALIIIIILIVIFCIINLMVRKTNGYKNFYRAIHVLKDVEPTKKYDIGVFGSTFSYYAFDLKKYNGHNFSVEPQSIYYMKKSVEHFIKNINEDGYVVIALTGCVFASNKGEEESSAKYQAYLSPEEFYNYKSIAKVKYYLNRYFPATNLHMLKCLIHDQENKYEIKTGVTKEKAMELCRKRMKGWERVLGIDDINTFQVDEKISATMEETTNLLEETINYIKESGKKPVLLILPLSEAFNELCPRNFYEKILYKCVDELKSKGVCVLDYLYDEELSDLDLYWTADCLNVQGRKRLSERMIQDLMINFGGTYGANS